MFQDISARRPALEEMDRPDIAPEALEHALRALVRMNTVSLGENFFWPSLRALAKDRSSTAPLRVLDVGCGAGDMSRRLERRAQRENLFIVVDGCDRNAIAIDMARREGEVVGTRGHFFVCDVLQAPIPSGYDAIICSLFLHHLGTEDGVRVLRAMADATGGLVIVSDLIRSRVGLALVYLATRVLTRSAVVHQDGVTSLRAAYTMAEVRALAGQAGLEGARIERHWPERFVLSWARPRCADAIRPEIVTESV